MAVSLLLHECNPAVKFRSDIEFGALNDNLLNGYCIGHFGWMDCSVCNLSGNNAIIFIILKTEILKYTMTYCRWTCIGINARAFNW